VNERPEAVLDPPCGGRAADRVAMAFQPECPLADNQPFVNQDKGDNGVLLSKRPAACDKLRFDVGRFLPLTLTFETLPQARQ
jgi:hypothetical protein